MKTPFTEHFDEPSPGPNALYAILLVLIKYLQNRPYYVHYAGRKTELSEGK